MDTLPFSQRRCQIGAIVVLAAVIALPPVWIEAQQSRQAAMTIEALAAKVKQLEDTKEITDVLIAYGPALDSRDFTAYSSLFAKMDRGPAAWAACWAVRRRSTTS